MQRKFKLLLSAYACEPNKGSEPGVGWYWSTQIANRGHDVWVLTRKNNKIKIEEYWNNHKKPENLFFVYYDLPDKMAWWKKGNKGVHIYYFLWQIGIINTVRKLHKEINFDFIHHITFVTIHQPCFLFIFKCPFFYGPAGGGDVVPSQFLQSFPLKSKIKELLLVFNNKLLRLDFLRCLMFRRSNLIFCNSASTLSFLPNTCKKKAYISLAIGSDSNISNTISKKSTKKKIKILYVGNLVHWKGLHIVLKTFESVNIQISSELTIIGSGKINEFMDVKEQENINYISALPQKDLFEMYNKFDLLLFPSFRDSGGMVVLEALSLGLPVLCLNLGGPGQIVDNSCGYKIDIHNKQERNIIEEFSEKIIEIYKKPELYSQLSIGAIKRSQELSWSNSIERVYEKIEDYLL